MARTAAHLFKSMEPMLGVHADALLGSGQAGMQQCSIDWEEKCSLKHGLRVTCMLGKQADAGSVSKRFQCWRKAVERSYNLDDFELQ